MEDILARDLERVRALESEEAKVKTVGKEDEFTENAQKVAPSLWLGAVSAATAPLPLLLRRGIKYVLTVGTDMIPKYPETLEYLVIDIEDLEYENILQHFNRAFEFIRTSLKKIDEEGNGAILVHCAAGRSRSVTVLAAWFMKTERISSSDALERIKRARSVIGPNQGFRFQLNLFERLMFQVPLQLSVLPEMLSLQSISQQQREAISDYLRFIHWSFTNAFLLSLIVYEYEEEADHSAVRRRVEKLNEREKVKKEQLPPLIVNREYSCGRCKHVLFRDEDRHDHRFAEWNETWWLKIPLLPSSPSDTPGKVEPEKRSCSHYSIMPVKWLVPQITLHSGSIFCPRCFVEIGIYRWNGMACQCLRFVQPAFFIDRENCIVSAPIPSSSSSSSGSSSSSASSSSAPPS